MFTVLLDMDELKAPKSLWDERARRWPDLSSGSSMPLAVALASRIRDQWDSRIFSPIDPADYAIKASVGGGFVLPVDGTATLAWEGDTTEDIRADVSAAEIESALNALTSFTENGGVTVLGSDGFFFVTWNEPGARTLITADASKLVPLSVIDVQRSVTGDDDPATNEVQTIRFSQNVGALATLDDDSESAAVQTTVETVTVGDGTHNHKVRINLPPERYGGEFTYTSGSEESDTIGWDDNAAQIEAAIEAISAVGAGNVSVTQDGPDSFLVAYKGTKGLQAIVGIAIDGSALRVVATKSGTLDLRTAGIDMLLNGSQERVVTFEIEFTPPDDSPPVKFQQDVLLRRAIKLGISVLPDVEDAGTGGSRVKHLEITIDSNVAGEDVIGVAFHGLTQAPRQVFAPWIEKVNPEDTNIAVVSVDSITEFGMNVNLSSGAIEGQILHVAYEEAT